MSKVINIVAPLSGPSAYSRVIDLVRWVKTKTQRVTYKIFDSGVRGFSPIAKVLLRRTDQPVVHIGTTDEVIEWNTLASSAIKYPPLFSVTSTAPFDDRVDHIYRLTPNDICQASLFSLAFKAHKPEGQVAVVYPDNAFGNFVSTKLKALIEFNEYKATTESQAIGIINGLQEPHVILIPFNLGSSILQDVQSRQGMTLYVYDQPLVEVPLALRGQTLVFNYAGELVETNKFREEIMDSFNFRLTINDFKLIDVLEALSFIDTKSNLKESISSYGKYSGSFHFNEHGDRDNHSFVMFKVADDDRVFTQGVLHIDQTIIDDGIEEYISSYSDKTGEPLEIEYKEGESSVVWDQIRVIDLQGYSKIYNNVSKVEITPSDKIIYENSKYKAFTPFFGNYGSNGKLFLFIKQEVQGQSLEAIVLVAIMALGPALALAIIAAGGITGLVLYIMSKK